MSKIKPTPITVFMADLLLSGKLNDWQPKTKVAKKLGGK